MKITFDHYCQQTFIMASQTFIKLDGIFGVFLAGVYYHAVSETRLGMRGRPFWGYWMLKDLASKTEEDLKCTLQISHLCIAVNNVNSFLAKEKLRLSITFTHMRKATFKDNQVKFGRPSVVA